MVKDLGRGEEAEGAGEEGEGAGEGIEGGLTNIWMMERFKKNRNKNTWADLPKINCFNVLIL